MDEIAQSSYHKHYHPDEHYGICVVQHEGESGEAMLKRFRKKYSKSGLAKEIKEKMFFEKPSDKKRRKRMQAIRLIKQEEEKARDMRERYKKMKMKIKKQKQKGAKNDSGTRR